MHRRGFAAGLAAAAIAGCKRNNEGPGDSPGPSATNAEAMARGAKWLAARRGAGGTWVSDVYGAFKDGWSLTPLAALALLEAGRPEEAAPALLWLESKTKGGAVVFDSPSPSYPAYTAALAVRALSHPSLGKAPPARNAWLAELRGRQLTEALGWSKDDAAYGGWGYSTVIPKKPAPGTEVPDAFLESNLSATAFAIDALAAAGVHRLDPAMRAAAVFVRRQQNPDGGFFFVPGDEVRNKAGAVDLAAPAMRFHSYGSMTADGLRSLLQCSSPETDGKAILSAASWLSDRFEPGKHPGEYRPEREEVRDSAWYYWAASLAQTARVFDVLPGYESITAELRKRQRADGSWKNDLVAVREDDPIVATSFALLALAAFAHS